MENKKFWKLENSVEGSGSKLYIDGVISQESWWGDEATPQQLRQELKGINGNSLEVVINSPGGDVWAGIAMYDALKELDAEVTIKVSGLAASIASVIAMAGDKIVMTPGSTMMIHRASTLAWGNADDMTKAIEMLETAEDGIVSIYADRTGQPRESVKDMMAAETWMSAEKAVELGFADGVAKPEVDTDDVATENIFAGNFAFSMKATKEAMEDYFEKAKAANQAEEEEDASPTPEPIAVVTETPAPTEPADEGDEAEEEIVETPEPQEEETKLMQDDIAKNQVLEPKAQATPDAKPTVRDYLKTNTSVEDFAEVLRAQAGKSFKEVKDAWKDAMVQNGLTDADYFQLPEPVITSIEDAVKASPIYSMLNHTGLDVFKVVWDDADEFADTSRAGGHKKGDTKDEQILDFDNRVIRAQYIYKYLVLDKETIRENRSTGALVRFVLNELPQRIMREIERAAIIGDGRANNNKRHITSFVSVKSDVVAGNKFASSVSAVAGESLAETIAKAKDLLLADGTIVLIAKKGFATSARFEKDTDGRLLFPLGTKATDVFDVETVIEPTWFTDATDPDYDAYLVVLSAYKTVGDNSIESFTNFKLETNENEFLQEIYRGGALAVPKAAVGIAAVSES